MKFEIGNPSDLCFLEADDVKIAVACILFLGNGKYFCKNHDTGESIGGSFFALGGVVEEAWQRFHGVSFDEFIKRPETKQKMATCFNTFTYAHERTSINNIGKRAAELAEHFTNS